MKNKPVSVKEIIEEFRDQLIHQYGEKEVMQFLYLLFDSWKGWTKAQVHLEKSHELKVEEVARFDSALDKLKKNNPIQYIIGETCFHGIRLKVNPDVMIPRPETEELVAAVAHDINHRKYKDLSILDICTGSGCIAISLKKLFPSAAVAAVDVSSGALQIARNNARINNCHIQFILSDILDEATWKNFPTCHIIIANPPYVTEREKAMMKKNVLDYEPSIALFVPDDNPLLYYQAITDLSVVHLLSPGQLYFEINEHFADEIKKLLLSKGFQRVEILSDIHQKLRFAKAEL